MLITHGLVDRDAPDAASALQTSQRLEQLTNLTSQSPFNQTNATAPISNVPQQEIEETLVQISDASDPTEVSRSATTPLLDTAAILSPGEEPTPLVDPAKAAVFFNSAQANIMADGSCGEDLKAIAKDTRIYFPSGGLTPKDAGLISARVLAKIAQDCKGYRIEVRGHSDPSGNIEINRALSKKRAEAVISRRESAGIYASLMVAVGMGDQQPSNLEGPQGSACYDRRVDFSVVKNTQTASTSGITFPTQAAPSECVVALERKVKQTRLFYGARAITVSPSEIEVVFELANDVSQCDGARLRVVGQHSDQMGDREDIKTGRMRALVLMGSLVSAGYQSDQIIVSAPSYSVEVAGQPSLPNSRVDFQIIRD